MPGVLRTAGLLLSVGLVSGCTMLGYSLGTSLPSDIQVIVVPLFENATSEPLLEVEMTRGTIEEFQREGSLSVSDESKADVTLLVQLQEFRMTPLRYETDATTTGEEYRFTVRAEVRLLRTRSGREMLRTTLLGETDLEIDSDMGSAKQRAIPAVAQNLGYRIVAAVVEYW